MGRESPTPTSPYPGSGFREGEIIPPQITIWGGRLNPLAGAGAGLGIYTDPYASETFHARNHAQGG